MKIERISDNQICCTLTTADLINKSIQLQDLAAGSEKVREFFNELMQQAKQDCGFEVENGPLMIEAIHQPPDSLKLIITKVDENTENSNPLNFGEFGPDIHIPGADGILNAFKKIKKSFQEKKPSPNKEMPGNKTMNPADFPTPPSKIKAPAFDAFRFISLDNAVLAAKALKDSFDGENSLYKDTVPGSYLLIIHCGDYEPEEYARLVSILTEYSAPAHCAAGTESYLNEHEYTMIKGHALQTLRNF